MNYTRIMGNLAAISMAVLVASCASSRVDANFGNSVRANVDAQIYDSAAAQNPSTDAVEGTDGQRMEVVMEAHRGQIGSAGSVSQPIVISVGQ